MAYTEEQKKWNKENKTEAIKIVLSEIADGNSLRSIFKNKDIKDELPSRKTFNEWLAEDRELSDHYARMCAVREDDLFDEILEIADNTEEGTTLKITERGEETTVGDMLNHRKLKIDARKYALSKMHPSKYGDRIINDNNNKNTEIPATKEEAEQVIEDIKQLALSLEAADKKE